MGKVLPQAGTAPAKVLGSPVGKVLPWAGMVLGRLVDSPGCTVLGRPVGKVLGRCPGRLARKQVVRVLGRTPAATALGRTWVGTVLERLGRTRAVTVLVRLGRTRVGMSVGCRVVTGGLGLLGLWFWWWRRWLLPV
ncbi:hypothetical protein OHB24_28015 [Kribbella sp. NBC_00482]|uniref:hypothetical protein n=1 Tax=Kribbella sp. NBC_00482 TaxID=2975968 RepID=UPI002E16D5CF